MFEAEKPTFLGKFKSEIKILSIRNLCLKFHSACRQTATSYTYHSCGSFYSQPYYRY